MEELCEQRLTGYVAHDRKSDFGQLPVPPASELKLAAQRNCHLSEVVFFDIAGIEQSTDPVSCCWTGRLAAAIKTRQNFTIGPVQTRYWTRHTIPLLT